MAKEDSSPPQSFDEAPFRMGLLKIHVECGIDSWLRNYFGKTWHIIKKYEKIRTNLKLWFLLYCTKIRKM